MSWKSLIFEEKEDNSAVQPVKVEPITKVDPPQNWPVPPISTSADDSAMYDKLKEHTDFSLLPNLKKLLDLAKPLQSVIPDPVLQLKAAYAQAATQGLSVQAIQQDLQKLDGLIQSETQKFQASVTDQNEHIKQDEAHASELETQLHQLRTSISERKSKLDSAQINFSSALSRRKADTDRLKVHLSSLGAA